MRKTCLLWQQRRKFILCINLPESVKFSSWPMFVAILMIYKNSKRFVFLNFRWISLSRLLRMIIQWLQRPSATEFSF